jgi:hypothetical protein
VLRASDAERERAGDLLREAMTSGRLTVEELDERMRGVLAAQTRPELERLVADVIVPVDDRHPLAGAARGTAPAGSRVPVRTEGESTHQILSVLSSTERKGRWRLGAACSVVSVLGSNELDMRAVELAADHVEMKVTTVLGSAELTLPAGLNVQISDLAVLGTNEIDIGDEQPDPGGPIVHLHLLAVLGSIEVRRESAQSDPARGGLGPVRPGLQPGD